MGIGDRDHHRGRARARRSAGQRYRLAIGVLGQCPDRDRRHRARAEIRPQVQGRPGRAFDPPGQALIIAAFASIIAATIEGPRRGWVDPWIVALIAAAVLAAGGLLIVEPRRSEPLIDLRFFRSPPSAGANTISVLMSASLSGFLFLNTLYLQDLRHFSPCAPD